MNGARAELWPRISRSPNRKMMKNIGIIHQSFCRHRYPKNSPTIPIRWEASASFATPNSRASRVPGLSVRRGRLLDASPPPRLQRPTLVRHTGFGQTHAGGRGRSPGGRDAGRQRDVSDVQDHRDQGVVAADADEVHHPLLAQQRDGLLEHGVVHGVQGVVDLIGVSGYYTLVSMVLNVADIPLP